MIFCLLKEGLGGNFFKSDESLPSNCHHFISELFLPFKIAGTLANIQVTKLKNKVYKCIIYFVLKKLVDRIYSRFWFGSPMYICIQSVSKVNVKSGTVDRALYEGSEKQILISLERKIRNPYWTFVVRLSTSFFSGISKDFTLKLISNTKVYYPKRYGYLCNLHVVAAFSRTDKYIQVGREYCREINPSAQRKNWKPITLSISLTMHVWPAVKIIK